MAKATPQKRKTRQQVAVTPGSRCAPPRWRILPQEIISIILEQVKDDEATLRACSLAAREFSTAALSFLGRHITVNSAFRIKQCAHMLTTTSAFQHVRSLDLGATGKYSDPKNSLEEKLIILKTFAQRQTLTRLWLSRVAFLTIASNERTNIQGVVSALGSTVNDLGLYGCSFPSYPDMISFIRAFPHCDSLHIRDCVTDGTDSCEGLFSGLPKHKLSLDVVEISSSSNGLIIDVSSLIEDASLDVSRLSTLRCSIGSAAQARSVASAISASPIRRFQLTSTKPDVFREFLFAAGEKWCLESLTIGPLTHKTDYAFWHNAFHDLPTGTNLKHLNDVTIIYSYPNDGLFVMGSWRYFDEFFSRMDIFPRSMQVDIWLNVGSISPTIHCLPRFFRRRLSSLRRCQLLTFNGTRWYRRRG